MPARILLLVCCVLLGAALAPAPDACAHNAQAAETGQTSLKDITAKIQQQKKKLARVEQEEAEVISRLHEIEQRLLQKNRQYETTAQDITRLQDDIRAARTRVQAAQRESDRQENIVGKRISALYKYYRRSGLRILLSTASYNDLLRTEHALGLIVDRDHALLGRSLASLKQLHLHEAELESRRAQLVEARTQIARTRDQIKSTQQQRSSHLDKIKQEKSLQLKALRELEEYSRHLQQFIDKLPGSKKEYTTAGVRFSQMRARLAFPVKGDIVERFGKQAHPELKTYTYQKGIVIQAPVGTPVRAVHSGRVAFADWFKGFGLMIIVDHGEHYYSLSAHASELVKKVDDIVAAGETIAHVGDTNSLKGAGLYFEIRYHGKPQDPLNWLKKGGNR